MDFKNKYLKYKIKYLELKNQIGGQLRVESIRPNSNSIQISNLPIGTTLTHLEDFLRMQGIPIGKPGLSLSNGNDFLINFKDNLTAVQQHHNVTIALTHYDPNTQIPGAMGAVGKAPSPVAPMPLGAVAKAQPPVAPMPPSARVAVPKAQPDFTRPWDSESKLFYVALPIAQSSELGKEIDYRFSAIGESSPFNFNTLQRLRSPHISLFSLYIRTGSDLDAKLSNKLSFDYIAETIRNLFIDTFGINTPDPVQLHSEFGVYETLGQWITRAYTDDMYLPNVFKENYTPFREQLEYTLLGNIRSFPPEQFTANVKREVKQAVHYARDSPHVDFTHYSMSPNIYPASEMAVSSWYTDDWKPHLSLIKDQNDPQDFIKQIQQAADKPMSFINLWSVAKTKMIPMIPPNGAEKNGSLEYIYCAYGQQHFTYKQI